MGLEGWSLDDVEADGKPRPLTDMGCRAIRALREVAAVAVVDAVLFDLTDFLVGDLGVVVVFVVLVVLLYSLVLPTDEEVLTWVGESV